MLNRNISESFRCLIIYIYLTVGLKSLGDVGGQNDQVSGFIIY